jgi:GR25 family glycosyltransferase involved in LPS biosynthesis
MNFKTFFINLKDNPQPWHKAQNLFSLLPEEMGDTLERISAIDTRQSLDILQQFGLTLNPVGLMNNLHFSQNAGEVGCFLSHYTAWNKIIEQDLDLALILEDDIVISDALNFLIHNIDLEDVDFINLNARNSSFNSLNFCGSEAYILSKLGAKKLIDLIKNCSAMQGNIEPDFNLEEKQKFNFELQNSIIAPVDKFLGYCTSNNLKDEIRLSYQCIPIIDLCKISSSQSSVNSDFSQKSYTDFSNEELESFINSDNFRFWDKKYSVSLCICTFDNYRQLKNTLQSALNQNYNFFEIIILDNTSQEMLKLNPYKENRRHKLLHFCQNQDNIRYIHEPLANLSKARNRCIEVSENDLIYFIDDDVILDKNAIQSMSKEFNTHNLVSVVGGKVLSVWPNDEKPEWLNEEHAKYYSEVDHGENRVLINSRRELNLVGANICFKKSIFQKVGDFDPALGRRGSLLLSGEEDDMIQKILNIGAYVKYSPAPIVHHIINKERCDKQWLRKRIFWQGITGKSLGIEMSFDKSYLRKNIKSLFKEGCDFSTQIELISQLTSFLSQGGLQEEFMYTDFKKAFVISINENKLKKYKNINFIEPFVGIDTRKNYKEIVSQYGFKEEVEPKWQEHFYTKSGGNGPGAFGCSLSHFMLWKSISQEKNNNDWFLILEDDACVEDVIEFSKNPKIDFNDFDLINLNNRPKPWKEFDGSDAYLIKVETAKKIIDYCGDEIIAPADKILFDPNYFRGQYDIKYFHHKSIGMAEDWKDSSLQ